MDKRELQGYRYRLGIDKIKRDIGDIRNPGTINNIPYYDSMPNLITHMLGVLPDDTSGVAVVKLIINVTNQDKINDVILFAIDGYNKDDRLDKLEVVQTNTVCYNERLKKLELFTGCTFKASKESAVISMSQTDTILKIDITDDVLHLLK